jgi:hypothetical protein
LRLLFGALVGRLPPHENRRNLHSGHHYYPLTIVGGAVFFIP